MKGLAKNDAAMPHPGTRRRSYGLLTLFIIVSIIGAILGVRELTNEAQRAKTSMRREHLINRFENRGSRGERMSFGNWFSLESEHVVTHSNGDLYRLFVFDYSSDAPPAPGDSSPYRVVVATIGYHIVDWHEARSFPYRCHSMGTFQDRTLLYVEHGIDGSDSQFDQHMFIISPDGIERVWGESVIRKVIENWKQEDVRFFAQ